MELNWSTFVLEIINFLVLVWILKRFLYQPVLAVVAKRRAGIEQSLKEAQSARAQAGELQEQYENRLAAWEREKQAARETLRHEIDTERTRLLDGLKASLEQERERARVADERRLGDALHRNEQAALRQGAEFAARLVSRLAGPDLEARLLALVLEELEELAPERREALRETVAGKNRVIVVASAYPIDAKRRADLKAALVAVFGESAEPAFQQDPSLIAGLRIVSGPWSMQANLQDELKSFAESAYESS